MNNVLRIKAISSCIGIRRSVINYFDVSCGKLSLSKEEYPLNSIDLEIVDIDDESIAIKIKEETILIQLGKEEQIRYVNKVQTLTGQNEQEYILLTFILMPLEEEAIAFYQKAIDNDEWFDEQKGEFEYIIGLIYEKMNMEEMAQNYFKTAKRACFKPSLSKIKG